MPIADTLLRLASEPSFYTPKWSPHILQEVGKTLKDKFGYSPEQVQRRIETMLLLMFFRSPGRNDLDPNRRARYR
jgi:hypothetical protein